MDGSEDDTATVRFVIPTGETELTVSECMMQAFQLMEKEEFTKTEWIQEEEAMNMNPTKTVTFIQGDLDVFVIERFEGRLFEHLTKGDRFKCTVVGPRCLISCAQTKTPVPNLPYPMYSLSMNKLNITCSALSKEEKEEMKTLIERMAGIYNGVFHDGITHLIAGNVISDKYKAAIDTETPVMTKEWVREVWKAASRDNVMATDPKFLQYKCPVFYGLTVTCSQLSKNDKNLLKKKIESHGGSYTPELTMDATDILICVSADGPKYSHALKWKIPCLKPDWVFNSVDKGYALPMDEYKITRQSNKASTPTKEDTTAVGLEEVSMCSTILNPDDTAVSSRVDDTVNSTVLGTIAPVIQGKTTVEWLAELDLQRVKKSGHFLDSLKIYLSGFTEKDQVLMTRVLKYAGATRLTQLVDSVTHVVNAVSRNVDPETTKILKQLGITPFSVSLEWIVESMKRGQKVPEKDYIFPPPETQNKSSEKMFKSPQQADSPQKPEETMAEENLLNLYKQKKPGGEESTTVTQDASSQVDPFFNNIKFDLVGLSEEIEQDLTEWIGEVGGELVFGDYTGVVDYLVTPVQGGKSKHKFKEHLNHFWIEDCLDNGRLVEKEYFHYPVREKIVGAPLKGIVTCVSGYSGKERIYINTLISMLGGNPQEMFAKKINKEKGVVASTHLICPEGEGQKYLAAVKWGLPVVNKDWLLACKKECKWISEQPFLVGDSKAFTKDKPMPAAEEDKIEEYNEEDVDDNDDTVLQDVDTNQSSLVNLSGRSKRSSVGDSKRKSFRSEMNESGEITLTGKSVRKSVDSISTPISNRRRSETSTPVAVAVAAAENQENQNRMEFDTPACDRLKALALTPGADTSMDKYKGKDLYSPLPSQPWPDSQSVQTPAVSGKRKRGENDLDDMPTPKTPYGDHLCRDPSPATRKFYKKRYDRIKATAARFRLDTEEFERQKRMEERWLKHDPAEARKQQKEAEAKAKWWRKAVDKYEEEGEEPKKDGRSLDEKMTEVFKQYGMDWNRIEEIVGDKHRAMHEQEDEIDEDEEEEGVLQGVTVYISRKILQLNKEIEDIILNLGGQITSQLCEEVTHFVFQGKNRDLSKEFRQAKEMKKIIVSPDWVYMCRSEKRRVDESAFPHTYNPRMSMSLSESQNSARSVKKSRLASKQKEKVPQPIFQEEEEDDIEMDDEEEEAAKNDVTEATEIIEDEAEENKAEEKTKSDDSYKKDLKGLESLLESVKNSPVVSLASSIKRKPMQLDMSDDMTPTSNKPQKAKEAEKEKESQVLWVDPVDEKNREALAMKLRMETQDLTNLGSVNFSENLSEAVEQRVFLVAGGVEEKELEEAVGQLGGDISTSNYFDKSVTHIISGKVTRSEKMLGCIAAGRWVLHQSYLKDSVEAGKWLQEEPYEWGNPEKDFVDLTSSSIEANLSRTARRRRLIRDEGGDEVFSGMLAYINLPGNRKGSFTRLILAGGGRITESLSDEVIPTITHVITDTKHFSNLQTKLSKLGDCGIPVIEAMYLNDYLTSEKQSSVESYIVQDYQSIWESRKRSRVVTDTPTNAVKKTRV